MANRVRGISWLGVAFIAGLAVTGCGDSEAEFFCTGPEDCIGGQWCVITNYDQAISECRSIETRFCTLSSDCTSCRNTDPSGNWQCVNERCINLNRTELNYAILEVHEDCPTD